MSEQVKVKGDSCLTLISSRADFSPPQTEERMKTVIKHLLSLKKHLQIKKTNAYEEIVNPIILPCKLDDKVTSDLTVIKEQIQGEAN